MKTRIKCLLWIVFCIAVLVPSGMAFSDATIPQEQPAAVDESLLLAIDAVRLAEPIESKDQTKAAPLDDNWKNAWSAVVKSIEASPVKSENGNKSLTPVQTAILGHALLALNRNAESLYCFVLLENIKDKDVWLAWTKAFHKNNPQSKIALFFHIDALARSAGDSKNGQTTAKGKIDDWYKAYQNKKSKDASAPDIMIMNLAGNLCDYSAATYLFQTANVFIPNLADAHANLGWCYLQNAAYIKAVDAFRKSLDISGDFPLAKLGLAIALGKDKPEESRLLLLEAGLDGTVSTLITNNPILIKDPLIMVGTSSSTPGTSVRDQMVQSLVGASTSGNQNAMKRTLGESDQKYGIKFTEGIAHDAFTQIRNNMADMGINQDARPMTADQKRVVGVTAAIGKVAIKSVGGKLTGFDDLGNNIIDKGKENLRLINNMAESRDYLKQQSDMRNHFANPQRNPDQTSVKINPMTKMALDNIMNKSNQPKFNTIQSDSNKFRGGPSGPGPDGGPGGPGPGGDGLGEPGSGGGLNQSKTLGGVSTELEGRFQLMPKMPDYNGLMIKRAEKTASTAATTGSAAQ